mgnify:CR=1 FL=1
MIKKTKIKFADGTEKTQIRVIKSIRCGEQKKPKQITVKSFGYLEDQTNLEEFWDEVRALDENMHDVRKKNIVLTIPTDIQNNAALNKDYNYGYVATQYFNSATGETADSKVSGINYDKITEEEKYDGYFCILTSELDYNAQKILDVYHNLWHIEESFRVTKSDLNTRPIYVYTNAHIEAHLLTCFVALTVLRVLQYKLRPLQIPAARIAQTMAASICRLPEDDVVWVNEVHGGYSYKEENGKASLELNEDDDYLRNDWLALQKSLALILILC